MAPFAADLDLARLRQHAVTEYGTANPARDRGPSFSIDETKARDFKIDGFKRVKEKPLDEVDELPKPVELVTDAVGELQAAIASLNQVAVLLDNGNGRSKQEDRP